MDSSAITTISLKSLILEARQNDEALTALLANDSLLEHVKKASTLAAGLYNEDTDAIQEHLWEVVRTRICKLKKPGSIRSWLNTAARFYCFKIKRHRKVERFHSGQVALTDAKEEEYEP